MSKSKKSLNLFNDIDNVIYENYSSAWKFHMKFDNYVKSLDLGIECINTKNLERGKWCCVYEIKDEKKWFLARIKYGI